jgi:hypothetical protein
VSYAAGWIGVVDSEAAGTEGKGSEVGEGDDLGQVCEEEYMFWGLERKGGREKDK